MNNVTNNQAKGLIKMNNVTNGQAKDFINQQKQYVAELSSKYLPFLSLIPELKSEKQAGDQSSFNAMVGDTQEVLNGAYSKVTSFASYYWGNSSTEDSSNQTKEKLKSQIIALENEAIVVQENQTEIENNILEIEEELTGYQGNNEMMESGCKLIKKYLLDSFVYHKKWLSIKKEQAELLNKYSGNSQLNTQEIEDKINTLTNFINSMKPLLVPESQTESTWSGTALFQATAQVITPITQATAQAIAPITQATAHAMVPIKEFTNDIASNFQQITSGVVANVTVEDIKSDLKELTATVTEAASQVTSGAISTVNESVAATTEALRGAGADLKEFVAEATTNVQESTAQAVTAASDAANRVTEMTTNAAAQVRNLAQQGFDNVTDAVTNVVETAKELISQEKQKKKEKQELHSLLGDLKNLKKELTAKDFEFLIEQFNKNKVAKEKVKNFILNQIQTHPRIMKGVINVFVMSLVGYFGGPLAAAAAKTVVDQFIDKTLDSNLTDEGKASKLAGWVIELVGVTALGDLSTVAASAVTLGIKEAAPEPVQNVVEAGSFAYLYSLFGLHLPTSLGLGVVSMMTLKHLKLMRSIFKDLKRSWKVGIRQPLRIAPKFADFMKSQVERQLTGIKQAVKGRKVVESISRIAFAAIGAVAVALSVAMLPLTLSLFYIANKMYEVKYEGGAVLSNASFRNYVLTQYNQDDKVFSTLRDILEAEDVDSEDLKDFSNYLDKELKESSGRKPESEADIFEAKINNNNNNINDPKKEIKEEKVDSEKEEFFARLANNNNN